MTNPALHRGEFLDPVEIDALHAERWRSQAAYVREHSSFYGARFGPAGLTGRLGELAELPFTDKSDLRTDQAAQPPFGSYLASGPDRVMRLHRTSGTTGTAMNLALSAADAAMRTRRGPIGATAAAEVPIDLEAGAHALVVQSSGPRSGSVSVLVSDRPLADPLDLYR